jgi:Uma2 family endonuclease
MAMTSSLTLNQFHGLEETEPASEYACGEAFQKPMPNRHHAAIQLFVGAMLLSFLQRTGLGRAFTEFRCVFGPAGRERSYVPDISVVSRERLTTDLHLHAAPDLAIEILSPDQHLPRFLDKIQFYLLYGVRLVWIIDPATETVTVEAPGQEARMLHRGETLDGGDVMPGFSLAVDDVFAQMQV